MEIKKLDHHEVAEFKSLIQIFNQVFENEAEVRLTSIWASCLRTRG